jgi:hypothetical protein
MASNPGHSAGQGSCPQVRHLHGRRSHEHTRVAVKAAMLCAEPTAPAWTTSDQQPRPTPTRPAATTVTTADPIAALRRPLRLPTLSQPHRVRSRGPTKSPRRSPRYLGMDPPTRPTAPGRGVTAGSMAAGTTPRCCGSPTPFLRPEPTRFLSWSDSTAARCGRDGERASPASQRRRGDRCVRDDRPRIRHDHDGHRAIGRRVVQDPLATRSSMAA